MKICQHRQYDSSARCFIQVVLEIPDVLLRVVWQCLLLFAVSGQEYVLIWVGGGPFREDPVENVDV